MKKQYRELKRQEDKTQFFLTLSMEFEYELKGNSIYTIYGIYRPHQIYINSFLDEFEQAILHRARAKKVT